MVDITKQFKPTKKVTKKLQDKKDNAGIDKTYHNQQQIIQNLAKSESDLIIKAKKMKRDNEKLEKELKEMTSYANSLIKKLNRFNGY